MKRWRAILGLVVVLVILAGTPWRKNSSPQVITLPNGEQYRFVTAEWGTRLVQPTFAARSVDLLPAPMTDFVVKKWGNRLAIVTPVGSLARSFTGSGSIRAAEPSLHFWFRSVRVKAGNMQPDFKFMLADENGVVRAPVAGAFLGKEMTDG